MSRSTNKHKPDISRYCSQFSAFFEASNRYCFHKNILTWRDIADTAFSVNPMTEYVHILLTVAKKLSQICTAFLL